MICGKNRSSYINKTIQNSNYIMELYKYYSLEFGERNTVKDDLMFVTDISICRQTFLK